MPKVDAIREILKEVNPYVRVITHHTVIRPKNVKRIFGNAEIIVEAFDKAEEKAMLINAISEAIPDTYIVVASGVAGYGDSNAIKTTRFSSKIFIVGDQRSPAGPGIGLMAPRVGIAAHQQANMVLRLILGEEGES
jgi:sulfur carrier protein ThiS adenylyltransferase